MTHTPGPWKVAENLFGNTVSYEVYANVETKSGKGGYTRICQITPRDQKANAHLIAAAPDMLEALESMLSIISESNGISGWHLNGNIATWGEFQVVIDIEEAIKKARGEE